MACNLMASLTRRKGKASPRRWFLFKRAEGRAFAFLGGACGGGAKKGGSGLVGGSRVVRQGREMRRDSVVVVVRGG